MIINNYNLLVLLENSFIYFNLLIQNILLKTKILVIKKNLNIQGNL